MSEYLLYAILCFYSIGVLLSYKSIDFAHWYIALPLSLFSWLLFIPFWSIMIIGELVTRYQDWRDSMDDYAAYYRNRKDY